MREQQRFKNSYKEIIIMIRQPIVILVGHIDHGKSSILERIKGISITKGEAGGITQCIKCYAVSLATIKKICGSLLSRINTTITIPGLLFLDSPGHFAFNNMRKRGGNLADIAILVIDANQGIQEQTRECIAILKNYKTPFVIAFNKIDALPGWRTKTDEPLLQNIQTQSSGTREALDRKIYELVGGLSTLGFNAERFDRVDDYTKQIAIVPVSAKTSEGIPDLLMVLTGMVQKYLENELQIEVAGPGKATVLEVNEVKGVGLTLDIILFDGTLKVNDQVVIGTLGKPIITKVKAIFEPEGKQLKPAKEVHAASGVKIVAPDTKNVIGGMPLVVANTNPEAVANEVLAEVNEVLIETDKEGVIVKADTLGSLEALVHLLREAGIKIKRASIGMITKKDIADCMTEKDPSHRAILGFRVAPTTEEGIKVITHEVIYQILDDYKVWQIHLKKLLEEKELEQMTFPCKIKIMRGCIFHQSNPAVVGVAVLGGKLKAGMKLMKSDGSDANYVKSIQEEGENIPEAEKGKEVAIAIPDLIVGRQIKEEDVLYSDFREEEFIRLKNLKKLLKEEDIEILKEIAIIKRKANPLWGI